MKNIKTISAALALFLLTACTQNPTPPINPQDPGKAESMTSRQIAQLCLPEEGNILHIHQNLVIMVNKQVVTVPANIGIDIPSQCIHPLHTHDETGVIHVESPAKKDFYLADFFAVWGQKFSKDQILDNKVDANHGLKFYIDGKESQQFENTILQDHQDLFIDYYNLKDGPDALPQKFDWNAFENPGDQPMLPQTQASTVKKINLVVQGKKLVSGPETIQVQQGDKVEITITSDQPEELHLHGYDKKVEFQKNIPATLSFTADISGHFEYELENSGTELGALEVQPQ